MTTYHWIYLLLGFLTVPTPDQVKGREQFLAVWLSVEADREKRWQSDRIKFKTKDQTDLAIKQLLGAILLLSLTLAGFWQAYLYYLRCTDLHGQLRFKSPENFKTENLQIDLLLKGRAGTVVQLSDLSPGLKLLKAQDDRLTIGPDGDMVVELGCKKGSSAFSLVVHWGSGRKKIISKSLIGRRSIVSLLSTLQPPASLWKPLVIEHSKNTAWFSSLSEEQKIVYILHTLYLKTKLTTEILHLKKNLLRQSGEIRCRFDLDPLQPHPLTTYLEHGRNAPKFDKTYPLRLTSYRRQCKILDQHHQAILSEIENFKRTHLVFRDQEHLLHRLLCDREKQIARREERSNMWGDFSHRLCIDFGAGAVGGKLVRFVQAVEQIDQKLHLIYQKRLHLHLCDHLLKNLFSTAAVGQTLVGFLDQPQI